MAATPAPTTANVRAAMARYGAGEIDATAAAEQIRPAYVAAQAERAERTDKTNAVDPDDAATPTPWTQVALARQTGVITPEQYDELGAALIEQA